MRGSVSYFTAGSLALKPVVLQPGATNRSKAPSKWVAGRVAKPGRSTRERIFERDRFQCVYCGTTHAPEELTLDHVEPRRKGGDGSGGNLVTCCRVCNTAKAGEPAWSWLAGRPEERANFLLLAKYVWPRLRRAIEEAAEKAGERVNQPSDHRKS